MRPSNGRPSTLVVVVLVCVFALVVLAVTPVTAESSTARTEHSPDEATGGATVAASSNETQSNETEPAPSTNTTRTTTPGESSFAVANLSGPSRVRLGESLTVAAAVTNRGTARGTETLQYSFDGETVATTTATLDPGATTLVTFTVSTDDVAAAHGDVEPGTHVHAVRNESGTGVATRVRVTPDVDFAVVRIEAPTEVSHGEPYLVLASVENPGDVAVTREVAYTFAGEAVAERAVTVAGNDTRQVAFRVSLAEVEAVVGPVDYETTSDHAVVTGGDRAGGAVRVVERPRADASSLAVESFETADDVRPGDAHGVTLTVRNVDTAHFEGQVAYRVDGSVVETEWVRVPIGEQRTIRFRAGYDDVRRAAVPLSSQRTTHSVRVGDESLVTRPVTVHAPTRTATPTTPHPTFTVTATTAASAPAPSPTAPTPTPAATVTDGGDDATCQRGFFSACGGSPLDEMSLTLLGVLLSGFGIVYEMYRGRR
jgi:hypothetical protein